MEAAEDLEFLKAMRRARIRGALVGIESVTPEGLKAVFKDFNDAGEALVTRLQAFSRHGVHVLGSFIFGLPTDRADTFQATADLAQRAGISFAQFVMLHAVPWNRRLREVGARRRERADRRRDSALTLLVDPLGRPAEDLRAAPGDVSRRDPAAYAGHVG